MVSITRGFRGRRDRGAGLPPGQYDAGTDWPVLTAEATPNIDLATWALTVDGLVERATTWSWDELQALPGYTYDGDIHCVTTWSKRDMQFVGVSVDTLLGLTGLVPTASHVLATSTTGYTTNLPLADVTGERAMIAWEVDGGPLPRAHGGPVRLVVPHLYFWKSAKWISRITVLDHDERGFWERNGYHDRGDPWLEQRYWGD